MANSLSNLVNNLTERIQKIKCKDCDCFLEYECVKNILIKYKCLSCNKDFLNKLDEEVKKRLENVFNFSNNDIDKFILLLRKVDYTYEYMDDWEKFHAKSLSEEKDIENNMQKLKINI